MNKNSLAIEYFDQQTDKKFKFSIWVFKKPTNDEEYERLEHLLDELIDVVGENENHILADIMQIIGENLEQYDTEHNLPVGHDVSDIDMVKYIMKSRGLHQKDLADIFGGQANVSKYLNGERALSKKQISGLKNRFGISPDFFL